MKKQMEVSLYTHDLKEIEFIMGRKLDKIEQAIYDLNKDDDETYEFFIDDRGFLASRKIQK